MALPLKISLEWRPAGAFCKRFYVVHKRTGRPSSYWNPFGLRLDRDDREMTKAEGCWLTMPFFLEASQVSSKSHPQDHKERSKESSSKDSFGTHHGKSERRASRQVINSHLPNRRRRRDGVGSWSVRMSNPSSSFEKTS